MDARFLGQPFNEDDQIGRRLIEHLGNGQFTVFRAAVAWAKSSGLSRLAREVAEFRQRGGRALAIVGVDEGGATREGLQELIALFDESYVFHDLGPRTFHPKIYLFSGDNAVTAVVGSGNFTKGGLFSNYEAAIELRLSRASVGDARLIDEIDTYLETLLGTAEAVRPLTPGLIDDLALDPRVLIESEAAQNRRRASRRRQDDQQDGAEVFHEAVPDLAGAPTPSRRPQGDDFDEDRTPEPQSDVTPDDTTPFGVPGFYKALAPNDVSDTNSPGQIIIPIRFRDFFPPLAVQFDRRAEGGPRQSDVHFPVRFIDDAFEKRAENARCVLYEPAVSHPRSNIELRFTFHDHEIFERLSADDVLEFTWTSDGIKVQRRRAGSHSSRYGFLSTEN